MWRQQYNSYILMLPKIWQPQMLQQLAKAWALQRTEGIVLNSLLPVKHNPLLMIAPVMLLVCLHPKNPFWFIQCFSIPKDHSEEKIKYHEQTEGHKHMRPVPKTDQSKGESSCSSFLKSLAICSLKLYDIYILYMSKQGQLCRWLIIPLSEIASFILGK